MTKKEIQQTSDYDLVQLLCYTCWRKYNAACKEGESAQRKCEKEIMMMKEEIWGRMNGRSR